LFMYGLHERRICARCSPKCLPCHARWMVNRTAQHASQVIQLTVPGLNRLRPYACVAECDDLRVQSLAIGPAARPPWHGNPCIASASLLAASSWLLDDVVIHAKLLNIRRSAGLARRQVTPALPAASCCILLHAAHSSRASAQPLVPRSLRSCMLNFVRPQLP
jgi:hypothetical protein